MKSIHKIAKYIVYLQIIIPKKKSNFIIQNIISRIEKGKLHMCSRSLIFESEKSETPIFKYFYRYYNSQPDIVDPEKNDQS